MSARSRSYNTKNSDNLISNGSIIAVNEGQCMMIVDQGAIVEVCAEAGEFVYDTSAEPSIFYGNLGKSIGDSFKQFGKRFTMGGDTARDQRVYFFNTKEIVGNKYGTANAVPFRVVDQNIGLDMDIAIRCHGEYSYRMVDPILFYKNICGTIEEDYTRDKIDSQLRSELLTALQPAFAKISGMGVRYSALPGHTVELANALREILSDSWDDVYGITVSKIGVSSVKGVRRAVGLHHLYGLAGYPDDRGPDVGRYVRHWYSQQGTGQQPDRSPKATQGPKQHPAVGMPQVRNYHPQH